MLALLFECDDSNCHCAAFLHLFMFVLCVLFFCFGVVFFIAS